MTNDNVGTCYSCKQNVTLAEVDHHLRLAECDSHQDESENIYLIKVSSGTPYWLYAEAKENISVDELYTFLRSCWFECCNGGSPLKINGELANEEMMRASLNQLLDVGGVFSYEHDTGFTPKVVGEIVSVRKGSLDKNVRLAARKVVTEDERCASCQEVF